MQQWGRQQQQGLDQVENHFPRPEAISEPGDTASRSSSLIYSYVPNLNRSERVKFCRLPSVGSPTPWLSGLQMLA